MSRTLAIGDIHGGLKALKQALQRAEIKEDDQFIFIGDYVDGWSESAQTVDFLIEFGRKNNCIFLRGNHDDLVHQWLKGADFNAQWMRHGGQSTIDSYKGYSDEQITMHKEFYTNLVDYHIDTNYRFFAHAGFQNQNGPEYEWHSTSFYWDRTLWEMAIALDPSIKKDDSKYPKRLTHFDEIYIGHTPVTRIGETTPVNAANVWNVDTGAAFKGPITVMDIATKKFWQSDPVWKLYPDENGRNG